MKLLDFIFNRKKYDFDKLVENERNNFNKEEYEQ